MKVKFADPSTYIERFAGQMDLGDKKQDVQLTAVRLLGRFKRDWIATGRTPKSLCAAALLVATRRHGFRRTQLEIANIVQVSDDTLRKRLKEFKVRVFPTLNSWSAAH